MRRPWRPSNTRPRRSPEQPWALSSSGRWKGQEKFRKSRWSRTRQKNRKRKREFPSEDDWGFILTAFIPGIGDVDAKTDKLLFESFRVQDIPTWYCNHLDWPTKLRAYFEFVRFSNGRSKSNNFDLFQNYNNRLGRHCHGPTEATGFPIG